MKNEKVLKDELNILKSDRSAILTEVRFAGEELKRVNAELSSAEQRLLDVEELIQKRDEVLSEMKKEEKILKDSLSRIKQDINTAELKYEVVMTRASHREKQHLGRIKELKDAQLREENRLEELKNAYDKNSNVLNSSISERKAEERKLNTNVSVLKKEVEEAKAFLKKTNEEVKKATKDRLKKEDKLRARERLVEREEKALAKKQEDFSIMASDVVVVYYRLKELYTKIDPSINFEKLVNKTI
jgi:chromosome segregation ATPase